MQFNETLTQANQLFMQFQTKLDQMGKDLNQMRE